MEQSGAYVRTQNQYRLVSAKVASKPPCDDDDDEEEEEDEEVGEKDTCIGHLTYTSQWDIPPKHVTYECNTMYINKRGGEKGARGYF